MANKTKKSLPPGQDEVLELILAHVEDLFRKHGADIETVRSEAEKQAVNISFNCTIDGSESIVSVETKMRYSQVVTDVRSADIDDPKQPRLPGTEPDKKGSGTAAKESVKKDAVKKD